MSRMGYKRTKNGLPTRLPIHIEDEGAGVCSLVNDPFVLTFPSSSSTFLERPRLWIETLSTLQTLWVALFVLLTQIFGPIYGFWAEYTEGKGESQCRFAGAYSLAMGGVLLVVLFFYVMAILLKGPGNLIAEQRLTVALLLIALLQMAITLPAGNGNVYPFECDEDWVFQKRKQEQSNHCLDDPSEEKFSEACVLAEDWPEMVCNVTTSEAKMWFFEPCGPTGEYTYNHSATIKYFDESGATLQVPCNVAYRSSVPWYVYRRFDLQEEHFYDTDMEADIRLTPCCVLNVTYSPEHMAESTTIGREWCRKACDECPHLSAATTDVAHLWDLTTNLVLIVEYSFAHLFTTDPSKAKHGWEDGTFGGLFSPAILTFYFATLVVWLQFHVNLDSVGNYVIGLLFMRILFKGNAALKRMSYLRTRARQLLFWAMMFPLGVRRFTIGIFIGLMYDGLEDDNVNSDDFTPYRYRGLNLYLSLVQTPCLALLCVALTMPAECYLIWEEGPVTQTTVTRIEEEMPAGSKRKSVRSPKGSGPGNLRAFEVGSGTHRMATQTLDSVGIEQRLHRFSDLGPSSGALLAGDADSTDLNDAQDSPSRIRTLSAAANLETCHGGVAPTLCLETALWSLNASLLVYYDAAGSVTPSAAGELPNVALRKACMSVEQFDYCPKTDTSLCLFTDVKRPWRFFLAFRGTASVRNARQDMKGWQTRWQIGKAAGSVFNLHHGFLKVYRSVKEKVRDMLVIAATTYIGLAGGIDKAHPIQLCFTGHSLGAAIATIAAADMVGRIRPILPENSRFCLYTYGSPKVGDARFAQFVSKSIPESMRILVNGDPITSGLGLRLVSYIAAVTRCRCYYARACRRLQRNDRGKASSVQQTNELKGSRRKYRNAWRFYACVAVKFSDALLLLLFVEKMHGFLHTVYGTCN